MFRENRPISDLVMSDFTYVDKELMNFYKMRTQSKPSAGEVYES